LAFSKEQKAAMIADYEQWLNQSQAVFLMAYANMRQSYVDTLRAKVRDAGGELHVVKNTLFKRVLDQAGMQQPAEFFEGTTIATFAFTDAAGMAKVINESMVRQEVFKVKGGYLGKNAVSEAQLKALADLPPLPVMRAMLLGTLLAPASKLVRTVAEPARSLARVFKAYSEREAAPVAG
jgi:large subunit ribosomal protein L10